MEIKRQSPERVTGAVRGNYHTHTVFCDGKNTPREMAEAALALGFTSLGFSGHVDISPVMDISAYLTEIRALQQEYADRLEILCGGEFDFYYPHPEMDGFDYKIGSNHHLAAGAGDIRPVDASPADFLALLREGFDNDPYALCEQYFSQVSRLPDRICCTFIGHFDLVAKFNNALHVFDEDDKRYVDAGMAALDSLLDRGMAFEINTKMIKHGRIYPHRRFLKRICERGGEILLSSDAHAAGDLALGFGEGMALALSCGFDHCNRLTMKNGRPCLIPVKLGPA